MNQKTYDNDKNCPENWLDLNIYDEIYNNSSVASDENKNAPDSIENNKKAEEREEEPSSKIRERGLEVLFLIISFAEFALLGIVCAIAMLCALLYLLFGGKILRILTIISLIVMPIVGLITTF